MAMVDVDSGSLYRWTHSPSRLAWSWIGGRLAPFFIHQMNRVNSRNGSAVMTAPQNLSWNNCLNYLSLLSHHRAAYLEHRKTDRVGPACQRRGGKHDHPRSHHRTWPRRRRHVGTRPSPATVSCAIGTSRSESSSPRPHQTPTKCKVCDTVTVCSYTFIIKSSIRTAQV